jgi:hypothetical protein
MPGRKPSSLNTGSKNSKQDRAARASVEAMVTPKTELTITPPAELRGKKIACKVWTRVIELQLETEAAQAGKPMITAFDERTLITYAKACQEELTLEAKLSKLDEAQENLYRKVKQVKPTKDNYRDWVSMWQQFNGLTSNFKGMSARLDAHRSAMHELAKSMYLTPSSRAGATPPTKGPEEPQSEMEKLL